MFVEGKHYRCPVGYTALSNVLRRRGYRTHTGRWWRNPSGQEEGKDKKLYAWNPGTCYERRYWTSIVNNLMAKEENRGKSYHVIILQSNPIPRASWLGDADERMLAIYDEIRDFLG